MSRLWLGTLCGFVYGALSAASMLPLTFSDKAAALTGAFLNRFAIGFVIGAARLPLPNWANGLTPVDAVLTLQAIHETRHRNRSPALFRQIRESLRPGGLFLYCDHYLKLVTNPALYLEREEQPQALTAAGFTNIERLHDEGGMALYRATA